MPRWTTVAVGNLMRLVVIPAGGLTGFILETQQPDPRWLIVGACLVMMGVLPASALFDRGGRGSTDAPPTPPTGPDRST